MAKKQFIRHLEFYGYPDQNGYASEAESDCGCGCGCVDLSEIIAKNKQQDREIECLTNEKADKKDLDALSATVETIISAQTEINIGFADAISGLSDDIESLKETDVQFAEQLNVVTDGLNEVTSGLSDAMCGIQILANEFDELSGTVEDLKETLENDYAKKDEVVSKDWIEEQGYLTVESGDSRYAKIEDLEDLAEIVSSITSSVDEEIDEINDKIDEFSGKVTTEIEEIGDKVDELEDIVSANTEIVEELKDEVSSITEDIAELKEDVSAITENIDAINDAITTITEDISDIHEQVDANTEDIAELQDSVSAISEDIDDIQEELDTKASQRDLDDTRRELSGAIETLDAKKADKEDLEFVSGAVEDLNDRLDAEIERSSGVDETMQAEIDALSSEVESLSEQVDNFGERLDGVESGLTQEIADREQAIIDLIGTSSDSRDADTIWGAKNYAKSVKDDAVEEANDYTDEKFSEFEADIINLSAATDLKLSKYATEEFVTSACQETEAEIRGELGTKIDNEIERATMAENNLEIEIQTLSGEMYNNTIEIAHNATRLNAITRWDGENPDDYPSWAATHPHANGVLDVLHREVHELSPEGIEAISADVETLKVEKFDAAVYDEDLKQIQFKANDAIVGYIDATPFIKDGMIDEVKIENGNLVIIFNTDSGKEEIDIPLSEIFDPSNYYTKDEVNAEIDAEEARAISAETDLQTAINTKTDKEVQGTNGKAIIFNESDGGGAKFEHNDGTESFVGVNDGGENGLVAQIYADKFVDGKWQGAKLDVTNGGMYYTVGDDRFVDRAVPENEIAVKGDIPTDFYSQEEVDTLLAEKDAEIDKIKSDYNVLKNIVGSLGGAVEWNVPEEGTLIGLLKNNGTVKLNEDTVSATYAGAMTNAGNTILNLNGKELTFSAATTTNPGIMTKGKETLTIMGKGTFDAGGRIAIEANSTATTINLSGTTGFFGAEPTYVTDRSGGELIYCYSGTINISAGIFKNNGEDKTYLLNCYDANYRNGKAKIIVTGGKFYDFNPADNTAEGEHTSFVPEGYHVETSQDGDSTVYTVKKD